MTSIVADNTPILIGVGEASERIGSPGYRQLSPTDLTAEAALRAGAAGRDLAV